MIYVPRDGIVKTKICGVSTLIPTRAVFEHCRTVQILPVLWAGTWDSLAAHTPMEKIVQVHKIFKKTSTDEAIKAEIQSFCELLVEKGFLVRIEEE